MEIYYNSQYRLIADVEVSTLEGPAVIRRNNIVKAISPHADGGVLVHCAKAYCMPYFVTSFDNLKDYAPLAEDWMERWFSHLVT